MRRRRGPWYAALAGLAAAALSAACASTAATSASGPPDTAVHSSRLSAASSRVAAAASASHHTIRFSAVGDTILGNTPNVPSHPQAWLAPIATVLRWRAGIVFGNLEGTLTTATSSKCGGSNGGSCFAFRNPPSFAAAFARTGFTVLNDANNHSHDYGSAGIDQTVRSIRHAGMKQTGLPGEITITHVHQRPVALVAFAPYSNTADMLDLSSARDLIRKAAGMAHVVIVYMHAGAEGTDAQHVTGREEYFDGEDRGNAERFAHLAIHAGADLVVASGPHVMRGMQFFHRHLIAYSLGNSVNFHNFGSGGVLSDSGVLHVTLSSRGRYLGGKLLPVTLSSDGQGHPGGDAVSVVRRLSKEDFGSSAARFGAHGRIRPPAH